MISEQIFLITNNKIYDYFSAIYGSRYVQASVLKMTCNKVMTHCNNSLIHCLCKDFYKSSHRRCSVRKGVFRNFAKFAGKHLCQNLFFNKYYSIYSGICKSFYSYTLVCPKKVGFFFQVEVRMNKNVLSYPKTEKQRNVMS